MNCSHPLQLQRSWGERYAEWMQQMEDQVSHLIRINQELYVV